ncbi:MAG: hypothetical protein ACTSU5_00660 [Promethearchaeota archaeon]
MRESTWKFAAAKKKYAQMERIAAKIDDLLTIEYCRQKLAQIEKWEQEIEEFDLHKWEIFPFKMINRRRYEFFEIFPSKELAEERLEKLVAGGMDREHALVVNVVRSKFKGQGPSSRTKVL